MAIASIVAAGNQGAYGESQSGTKCATGAPHKTITPSDVVAFLFAKGQSETVVAYDWIRRFSHIVAGR
jgi:hypothetical protein